jgi:hypothetical protein
MTPSAKRLLGLIKHRAQSESVYWVRLNLTELAQSLELTTRTMMRAKAELTEMGLIRFRTISNGNGRGHKIHAALPERIRGKRGELMHSHQGKDRHSWTHIGGQRIERVSQRPPDTTYTKGTLRVHQIKPRPAKWANLARRKPSKRQVAFAHWLKRDLWERFWWENCKVERSDAHLFGYALRSLRAGYDVKAISHCFEKALKEMHGTATDVGLATGDTRTVFCLSSTVSRATEYLQSYQRTAEGKEPDGIAKRSVGSKDAADKTARCWVRTSDFNGIDSEQATPVSETRPPTHGDGLANRSGQPKCQRARFASIMDALA